MHVSGTHRAEGARRWGGLADAVVAPAGHRAVRLHAAGVEGAAGDRAEGASRWGGLALVTGAPAGEGAVRLHSACVDGTGVEASGDCARWRGCDRDVGGPARRRIAQLRATHRFVPQVDRAQKSRVADASVMCSTPSATAATASAIRLSEVRGVRTIAID